ncbi:MAG: OmpA family protein [Bacteroidota bacterium]
MNALFTILFLCSSLFLYSQERIINLVPNPSFEELRNLPLKRTRRPVYRYEPTSGYIPFRSNLNFWFKGTQSTPDLRITSPALYQDCSRKFDDCDKARTGQKMVGLMTWLKNRYMDDYREYLQVRLKKPLEPNKKAYISIWVSKEQEAKLVSNNLGVNFSMTKIFKDTEGPFNIKPQLNCDSLINGHEKKWVELKWEFIPDKPFEYVTIGNFYGNENTDTMIFANCPASPYKPKYAYYLLDDVKIWQEVDTAGVYVFEERIIEKEKPFELQNILFEFNQAILDTVSFVELKKLIVFLRKHPELNLEIHGHTDNKGNDDYNLKLSRERAAAVYQYLIEKEIAAERLKYQGFGEEKPISKIDEENRRVEFFIK